MNPDCERCGYPMSQHPMLLCHHLPAHNTWASAKTWQGQRATHVVVDEIQDFSYTDHQRTVMQQLLEEYAADPIVDEPLQKLINQAVIEAREAEERRVMDALGVLGTVLARRPARLDCRSEVLDFLRELTSATPVEPWRSGQLGAVLGTSVVLDEDLEPGWVRSYELSDTHARYQKYLTFIGDL